MTYNSLFKQKINTLKKENRYRHFIELERIVNKYPLALWHNNNTTKEIVVWCSNDYLGMGQNLFSIKSVKKALDKYGIGSGGTRNISGTSKSIVNLENELKMLHNKERAIVFTSGYVANETSISTLLSLMDNPIVFSDELNHASIISGIKKQLNINKVIFRHNDINHLESLLNNFPFEKPKIIIFESVYSMNGSIAPIDGIVKIAKKFNALTYLDEVHAVGMYGKKGGGIAQELNLEKDIDIIQGTFAKAYGAVGGYIASSELICDAIRSYGSGFIFTSALPPAIMEGALSSIKYLKNSSIEREAQKLKVSLLKNLLKENLIPFLENKSHIIPIIVGDAKKCSEMSWKLLEKYEIYIQPINYPTVNKGEERLRITPGPFHTDKMIKDLVKALKDVFDEFKPPSYFDLK